jgi:hypothetical protein
MPSTSTASAIALFENPAVLIKLPPKIPDPHLHWERVQRTDGHQYDELVAYEKFKLWQDKRQRLWRWALREWPDDGLPLANHGGRPKLEHAIVDCYRCLCLRQAVEAG